MQSHTDKFEKMTANSSPLGSKAAYMPRNQEFAASAIDSMKPAKSKGSKHALGSGICCLRRWPDETRQEQRQQTLLGIKNLLPPLLTRWSPSGAKAAYMSWGQEFAASAIDSMKLAKSKGSKRALGSRICCHRRRSEEKRLIQRRQSLQEIKNLLPLALNSRNTPRAKAADMPWNQEFAAFAMCMKKLTLLNGNPASFYVAKIWTWYYNYRINK